MYMLEFNYLYIWITGFGPSLLPKYNTVEDPLVCFKYISLYLRIQIKVFNFHIIYIIKKHIYWLKFFSLTSYKPKTNSKKKFTERPWVMKIYKIMYGCSP